MKLPPPEVMLLSPLAFLAIAALLGLKIRFAPPDADRRDALTSRNNPGMGSDRKH